MLISIAPKGLDEVEQDALKANLRQLNAKRRRALLRDAYYDGKKRLEKYGISIPPQMADFEAVVGWPAKACDSLAARMIHQGFVMAGKPGIDPTLETIFAQNQMAVEWPQGMISCFINGSAFASVMQGDTSAGEPETLILMMPATEATGIWNVRRRGLDSAFWMEIEDRKPISRACLFLPSHTVEMTRDSSTGPWALNRVPNPLPRLGVTALRYQPRMGRPFGMSRITRSVMSFTDQAVRTMLRSEVSAEFYSSPQRWAMGADESMFEDEDGNPITKWEAILGKVWALPRDDDGNVPEVGQFAQMTMQPHLDQLRSIGMMYSSETSIPVSSLGIIHDNPASAEAIDATWADMVGVATIAQRQMGVAAVEIGQNALMLANGDRVLPDSFLSLRSKWGNPATPTLAAMTDAVVKQIQVGALLPDSVVALEQMGYDQTDIERIKAEHDAAKPVTPPVMVVPPVVAPPAFPPVAPEPAIS